jgi:putative NADH-flavin reductase
VWSAEAAGPRRWEASTEAGCVGSKVLTEALEQGHEVTAIVRHPEKLPRQARLVGRKADVYDAAQVAAAVEGHDAVISAFNPGWRNPDIYNLHVKGSQAIQSGVKRSGVKRLVAVGGAGSLEVAPGVQLVDTPNFPAEYKQGALGAREALKLLKQLGGDQVLMNASGPARISVEDLAVAILYELEKPQDLRKRFTAAY